MSAEKCTWSDDRDGFWYSDCQQVFIFNEEGPIGNGFAFCPFCGKPIAEDPEEHDPAYCDTCGEPLGDGICAICTDPGMQ